MFFQMEEGKEEVICCCRFKTLTISTHLLVSYKLTSIDTRVTCRVITGKQYTTDSAISSVIDQDGMFCSTMTTLTRTVTLHNNLFSYHLSYNAIFYNFLTRTIALSTTPKAMTMAIAITMMPMTKTTLSAPRKQKIVLR